MKPLNNLIINLAIKNQLLISKSLDIGLLQEARELQKIDRKLGELFLLKKFSLVSTIAKEKVLLVGEGNLSFALSLAKKPLINAQILLPQLLKKKMNYQIIQNKMQRSLIV